MQAALRTGRAPHTVKVGADIHALPGCRIRHVATAKPGWKSPRSLGQTLTGNRGYSLDVNPKVKKGSTRASGDGGIPMDDIAEASGRALRQSVRDQLQDVLSGLLIDYCDQVAPGSVVRCVARCTYIVTHTQVDLTDVPVAVETLARARLDARVGQGPGFPAELSRDSGTFRIPEPKPSGATLVRNGSAL